MPWFYVDDAFADSKPVMQLDRALRNEAVGLWVRCGAWSAKEETDGRVPLDIVRQFGGTPRVIRALHEQAQLWVENSPKSWQISREILFGNWEKWQRTRAENQDRRKRDAARQQAWRTGRKGRGYVPASTDADESRCDTDDYSEDVSRCDSEGVSRCESQRPDPTRPDPPLLVTTSGGVTSVDANGPRPHCNRHPNSDHPEPCRACGARRKWDEQNAETIRRDELDAKRRARERADRCPVCQGTNWIPDTEPAVRCQHTEVMHA